MTNTTAPKLASRFQYGHKREISSDTGLTEDQLRRAIPSIFAESAHESRSSRYAYIPTWFVLDGLMKEGFRPYTATTVLARGDRISHCKHMVRLRHESALARQGGEVNELILLNSHDGASAYQLMGGCFRFVCSNGMIVGDKYGEVRVRHSGKVRDEVIEGAYEVVKSFEVIDASREVMKSTQLSEPEQRVFARRALLARFPDKAPEEINVRPEQVVEPRRWADRDDSLWTTFQRAQENLVRGGLRTADRRRRTHTRGVTGIDTNVSLNRALWGLAEEMAAIKNGTRAA